MASIKSISILTYSRILNRYKCDYINIFAFGFPSIRWTTSTAPRALLLIHGEELLEFLEQIIDVPRSLLSSGPALSTKTTPERIAEGIESEPSRSCTTCTSLLLFITVHACGIIDLTFAVITQCFISSKEVKMRKFNLSYSLISENFSLASGLLFTSGWNCFASLKYAFLMSSLLAPLTTPKISKNFFRIDICTYHRDPSFWSR